MGLHSFQKARALAAEQAALAAAEAAKPMPVQIEDLPKPAAKRVARKKVEPAEVEPAEPVAPAVVESVEPEPQPLPAEALEPIEAPVDTLPAE